MKKNIVQDVLPPKKSIRNVEIPGRGRATSIATKEKVSDVVKAPIKQAPKDDPFTRPVSIRQEEPIRIEPAAPIKPPINTLPQSYKYEFDEPKKKTKTGLYISISVLLLAGAFGISALFRSAEIKVTPQEKVKTLNDSFSAKKDVSPNNLSFQVVSVSKDIDKIVDPKDTTGEQKVEKKAQGRIVIYNSNPEVQKLVATTRFQTPEGLIYRLISPATVPARIIKDGKTTPGSVEALVEADKTGPSYNIGLKDFTIPGFKGDPKFSQVYGRSKTEMTGGFSGIQKVVSKDVQTKIETEMETTLKSSLYKDLANQIPADFILYQNSLSYKFDPVNQIVDASGNVVLKKRGTTSAIIFDRAALTRAIQSKILPEANNDTVKISNLDELVFSYQATSTVISSATSQVNFSLKGEPNFVWIFDENKLKNDLLGLSKKNAEVVISKYSSIKETWVLTRPFWNQTIPGDPSKVTLINTLTK